MRKQDHLIKLISTLSPAEKRYFKQFSSIQPGEKRYMHLFDALENETQYDASGIMEKLNIDSKQLRDDKHYLTQSLLKCLRNYEQVDVNLPVQRLVEIARSEMSILMGRGLWEHALELAEKNFDIAMESEMFDMAGNLMAVQYVCFFNLERFDRLNEKFFSERERIAKILEQNRELLQLNCIASGAERSRKANPALDKILTHDILKRHPESLYSVTGQSAWFDVMLKYYMIKEDNVKALDIARMQWKHFDKHKTIRRLNPFVWVKSYSELAYGEMANGNPAKSLELLYQMDQILHAPKPPLSKGSTRAWNGHVYVSIMLSLFKLNRFKDVIKKAESSDSPFSSRPVYEQFLFLFYHGLALLHEGQSDLALLKLNELLQLNAEERKDIQVFIRPAIILCQLNLGNFQSVPYLIKSAKSWMKRQKNETPEINLFFSLAYSIAKAPTAQRPQRWNKLRDAVKGNKLKTLNKELNLSLLLK